MSACVFVCVSVGEDLQDGESDLHRIWLVHAKTTQVESEIVVVFRTSPATTRFPADQTSLRSRANISVTAHRISTEFKLLVPDVGRNARRVSFIAGDVDNSNVFLCISGSLNITPLCVCPCTRIECLPCWIHLFAATAYIL